MKILGFWRTSPAVRFVVRNVVVAAAVYVLDSIRLDEVITFAALWHAAVVAGCTSLVGLLTPIEPFVGVGKVPVEVPSPPAEPTMSP